MLNISLQQKMSMKLSPQQVQYLKLLQLPMLQLEQRIKAELEVNPLLEEAVEEDLELNEEQEEPAEESEQDTGDAEESAEADDYTLDDFLNDDAGGYKTAETYDGEQRDEVPIADSVPLYRRMLEQFHLLDLCEEEFLIGQEIIGNLDEDGYLRRDLHEIVQDLNLTYGLEIASGTAESVLKRIQHLDPPGIGSYSLQECLIVQMELTAIDTEIRDLSLRILREYYNDFAMRHFEEIASRLNISLETLKKAIEAIQHLNPKPGEGEFSPQQNYVVPDFIVSQTEGEFTVTLNDRNIPPLRINKAYKEMMSKKKKNGIPNDAKDFIRKSFENAKWFISSIHQRRETMLKVMKSIVERQTDFFETGEGLKPLIYKDIAEMIKMDISTISRVVNSKYVQTDYGVFQLRYFFSDSISTDDGELVSNKEVKKKLKVLVDGEDPLKPLSDLKIAELLNAQGLNIARRTVAKYREAMSIPVARLRRKLM